MNVLVPAYEPDARLPELVTALLAAEPGLRVLVVDDGSGPSFGAVFAAARAAGAEVVHLPVNRGKGFALKAGFARLADRHPGEGVVCADSDGQHGVADVLRVARLVRDGDDLVLGVRRFAGAVPARSRFGNSVTRVLFRLGTGVAVQDTQTGLRGYAGHLLPWLRSVPGDRFEYELRVLLRAAREGRAIRQVEIATIYLDGNASSHFRPLVDSARIYAPLALFLLSSFAAFLVDTVALVVLQALTGSLLLSVAGARLVSASVNFAVNRRVVFAGPRRRSLRASAVRYGALAVVLLAINVAVLTGLTRLGMPLLAAKLLTEVALLVVSYELQRRVVFRRSTGAGAGAGAGRRGGPVQAAAPRPVERSPV